MQAPVYEIEINGWIWRCKQKHKGAMRLDNER
jgi:hypothetical protein